MKQTWWQSHRPTTRRLIQLYSALLHNAHVKGFISGQIYQGAAKYACVPGLNCYSCPGAAGACPLGAMQNALASTGHSAGWYVLGILLLFGVVLGRTVCGWLCPMGLIQELIHKIPTPKLRKGRVTRAMTWLKYAILAVFAIALPLWYGLCYDLPLPGFCKYICPAGTSEGAMGLLANTMPANTGYFSMLGILFTRKFVIMLVIALACAFCYRAFCRFICPLGAIYGLFNRFNVIGVKVDAARCNGCGACVRGCPMDVRRVGDHECIQCGKCVDMCNQGAIAVKAGKWSLKGPEKRANMGRVLWGIALAGLCFALLWFNVLDPAVKKEPMPGDDTVQTAEIGATAEPVGTEAPAVSWESDAPEGREVGERLPDFTLPCYDGSTFRLAEQRGKVTFINLWATSCTPCKHELPYFSDLYKAHEGDVAMLVVHSSMVLDDPAEYLADKGYAMPFATDDDDDTVAEIVGNTGTFPQTVVLNRRGEVVYNKVGSVTPEMLAALFEQAE
ncbi:MAG: redoxin family protein [Clostridia bacterium]|nr:redoxin family protein [Clostridia bacterium]